MNQSSFSPQSTSPAIDEYRRKRLMPVEGAIPRWSGIDTYGNSIPAGTVGGDLLEYINFQRRYNIDGRITRALKLAKVYLAPLPLGNRRANPSTALEYRKAKSSEQLQIADDLPQLRTSTFASAAKL